MIVDPRELVTAAVVPGLEDHFADWRSITVPESPNNRFLNGDEIAYRLLMLAESGRQQVEARVSRFLTLVATIRRSARIDPLTVVRRPDGRLLIVDGNHRAAIALKFGWSVTADVCHVDLLLRKIDAAAAADAHYRDWVAPMRREIVMQGAQCSAA